MLGVQGDRINVVVVDHFLNGHDGLLSKSLVFKHYNRLLATGLTENES